VSSLNRDNERCDAERLSSTRQAKARQAANSNTTTAQRQAAFTPFAAAAKKETTTEPRARMRVRDERAGKAVPPRNGEGVRTNPEPNRPQKSAEPFAAGQIERRHVCGRHASAG